jgi:hypothetical protein
MHYDVTLDPSLPKRMMRATMEEVKLKHHPKQAVAQISLGIRQHSNSLF